jgi:hypothetical protein
MTDKVENVRFSKQVFNILHSIWKVMYKDMNVIGYLG